eukprot:SM000079S22477  [mRNA]  locus=s79:461496:463740:+ [translate_table: standard]
MGLCSSSFDEEEDDEDRRVRRRGTGGGGGGGGGGGNGGRRLSRASSSASGASFHRRSPDRGPSNGGTAGGGGLGGSGSGGRLNSADSDWVRTNLSLRVFSFAELRAATRNFDKACRIGEGGFGVVYKAWIDGADASGRGLSSGKLVAVKQLDPEGVQGHAEWLAEVNILGSLKHPHLVTLIGYCAEDDQRLLVYEFMARGSLEAHLFGGVQLISTLSLIVVVLFGGLDIASCLYAWLSVSTSGSLGTRFCKKRQAVAENDGLPWCILSQHWSSKLSDFGLAKDGPEGDKTHVSTRVMGTYGYAAPEYVMTGHLTTKSDVYSFGVVLLEMLTGRRSMDKNRPPGETNLVEWAKPFFAEKRKLFRLIDPRLEGLFSVRGAQKAFILAHHCLSRDPKSRPMMSDVVETMRPIQNLTDMAADVFTQQGGSGAWSQPAAVLSPTSQLRKQPALVATESYPRAATNGHRAAVVIAGDQRTPPRPAPVFPTGGIRKPDF